MSSDFVPFLRQRPHLGLDKEDAVEMYYNFSVTKWLNAALDLQVIDPALNKFLDSSGRLQNMSTSVVGGLRICSRFQSRARSSPIAAGVGACDSGRRSTTGRGHGHGH